MSDPAALAEAQPVIATASEGLTASAVPATDAAGTPAAVAPELTTAEKAATSSPALAQSEAMPSPGISFTFGTRPRPVTPPRPASNAASPAAQDAPEGAEAAAPVASAPTEQPQRAESTGLAASASRQASPTVPFSSPHKLVQRLSPAKRNASPTKSMESEEEGAIDEDEISASQPFGGQRNTFNDRSAPEHRAPGWGRNARDDHAAAPFPFGGPSRHDARDRFSPALTGRRGREQGGREPYGRSTSLSLSLGAPSGGRGGFGGGLEERGRGPSWGSMERRSPDERREHERWLLSGDRERAPPLHSPPLSAGGAPISGPNATPVNAGGAPVMRTWGSASNSGAASGPSSPVTPWRANRFGELREARERATPRDRSESESRRIRAPSVSISEGARRGHSSQPSPVIPLEDRFDGPRPSLSHQARRSPELKRRSISRDASPRRLSGAALALVNGTSRPFPPRGFAPPPRDSGYASRNRRTGSECGDASEREAEFKPARASSEKAESRAPLPATPTDVCVKMEEDREPAGPRTPPRPQSMEVTSPVVRMEELERLVAVPRTPPRVAPAEAVVEPAPSVALPPVSNPVAAADVGAMAEYAKQDGAVRADLDAVAASEAVDTAPEVKMEVDEVPAQLVQVVSQPQPMEGVEATAPPPSARPSLAAQIHTADPSSPDATPSREVIDAEARMQVDEAPLSSAAPAMMSTNAEVPVASIPSIGAPEPTPEASLLHLDIAKDVVATAEPVDANGNPLLTPGSQRRREDVARETRLSLFQKFRPDEVEVQRTLRDNKRLSMQTTLSVMQSAIHGPPLILEGDLWIDEDAKETQVLRAHLMSKELERKQRLDSKVEALRKQYKTLDAEWQAHCARLDRIAELREQARRPAASTPAGALSTAPAADEHSGGLLASVGMTRGNRRNQTGFAGFGDAVRSEAEFLAILASLETADMQDPNVRAARTTAVAPDMFVNADGEGSTLSEFDDDNGFVRDPVQFYLSDFDPDFWSEEEKSIFDRRYTLFPKQFGKIAASLPDKTATQCVRYYYLTKKLEGHDYKAMTAARNRERKRKTRGKPKKAKGSALMADLKIAHDDDDGDEEGISPSDPASSGKKPRARMLTGLDSSLATVEEEDDRNPRKRRAMMGSAMHPDDDSPSADGEEKRPKGTKGNKRVKSGKSKSALAAEGDTMSTPPGDSDMAAVEALGALAGLFPGSSAVQEGKAAKKRKSKGSTQSTTAPGTPGSNGPGTPTELSAFAGDDSKRRPATSSYWSIAERNEFLRSLAIYGKDWDVIAGKLNNKSAAQARNYFQRNALDVDFAEAAVLGDENAALSLEEREAAADALALKRKASEVGSDAAPRTGYFSGPGGMSLDSPGETPRGLRINSLLNDDSPAEPRRRSAVPDWFNSDAPQRASTVGPSDAGDDTDEEDTAAGRSISRPATAGPPGGNVAHFEHAYQHGHHMSAAQHARPPLPSSQQQQHVQHQPQQQQQQRPHYLAPRPDVYQTAQSASPVPSSRMGSMPPPSAFASASNSRYHSTAYPEPFRYNVAPAAPSDYRSTAPSNVAPGTQVARPDLSQHSRSYERGVSASYSAHSLSPEQRSNSSGWLGKATPPVAQRYSNSPSAQHASQVPTVPNASWTNPGYSASTASHFSQPPASGRVSPYAHSAGSSPRHSIAQQVNSERNAATYLPPPSSFAAGINRPASPHSIGSPAHSPYMRPTSSHGSVPQLPQLNRQPSPSPQQHQASGYGHPQQQQHQHYSPQQQHQQSQHQHQQQQQQQHGQPVAGRHSPLPPPNWPQR